MVILFLAEITLTLAQRTHHHNGEHAKAIKRVPGVWVYNLGLAVQSILNLLQAQSLGFHDHREGERKRDGAKDAENPERPV